MCCCVLCTIPSSIATSQGSVQLKALLEEVEDQLAGLRKEREQLYAQIQAEIRQSKLLLRVGLSLLSLFQACALGLRLAFDDIVHRQPERSSY